MLGQLRVLLHRTGMPCSSSTCLEGLAELVASTVATSSTNAPAEVMNPKRARRWGRTASAGRGERDQGRRHDGRVHEQGVGGKSKRDSIGLAPY